MSAVSRANAAACSGVTALPSEAGACEQSPPSGSVSAFAVFGDWRDLRGAIERAAPEWASANEETRKQLWDFAEAVIAEYAPFKFQCWGCKQVLPLARSYRCADCHAPYCERCITPHFGPNHRRHA